MDEKIQKLIEEFEVKAHENDEWFFHYLGEGNMTAARYYNAVYRTYERVIKRMKEELQ